MFSNAREQRKKKNVLVRGMQKNRIGNRSSAEDIVITWISQEFNPTPNLFNRGHLQSQCSSCISVTVSLQRISFAN